MRPSFQFFAGGGQNCFKIGGLGSGGGPHIHYYSPIHLIIQRLVGGGGRVRLNFRGVGLVQGAEQAHFGATTCDSSGPFRPTNMIFRQPYITLYNPNINLYKPMVHLKPYKPEYAVRHRSVDSIKSDPSSHVFVGIGLGFRVSGGPWFFFPRFGSALVWLPWSSGPGPPFPGFLVPWSSPGPLVPGFSASVASWLLGFGGFLASRLQWLRGSWLRWLRWLLGFSASVALGFLASWLLGFSASVAPWLLRT